MRLWCAIGLSKFRKWIKQLFRNEIFLKEIFWRIWIQPHQTMMKMIERDYRIKRLRSSSGTSRLLQPFSHGNRVCSFSFCSRVEMFFSLLYLVLCYYSHEFGLQKQVLFSNKPRDNSFSLKSFCVFYRIPLLLHSQTSTNEVNTNIIILKTISMINAQDIKIGTCIRMDGNAILNRKSFVR